MFFMYATQVISIMAAAKFWQILNLEYLTYIYIMILLKVFLLIFVTFFFRLLIWSWCSFLFDKNCKIGTRSLLLPNIVKTTRECLIERIKNK